MLGQSTTSCVPCGLHQPVRNNYFDGKPLFGRDFTDEQDYVIGHRRMHNSYLHGSGTVRGLKLIEHPAEACRREYVVCEPGLALDCCGQEIVVPERALVRVREMIDADGDLQTALDGRRHLFIEIERRDAGTEPAPVILPGHGSTGPTEFGRVAEGFRFRLSARAPQETTPVEVPVRPVIDWVHSFTYDGATPKAVSINGGESLVQIAMDDPTATNTYAYDLATGDLHAVLAGPDQASDTASIREARLVLVAGAGFHTDPDTEGEGGGGGETATVNGVGVWQAGTMQTRPRPVGIIPTQGTRPRLAVSPASGTLYVLDIVDGGVSRLHSYSSASLTSWLPSPTAPAGTPPNGQPPAPVQSMNFVDHGFGGETDAAGRGAAMMEITRDGRFLVLVSPDGEAHERLYLISTASFASGGLTAEEARPAGFSRPTSERLEAVRWSYDDAYLHVLTRRPAGGGGGGGGDAMILSRFALVDSRTDLERVGSGVTLRGRGLDLALAPTETRAYLLLTDPDGKTRFTAVDLDVVRATTSDDAPTEVGLSPETIRFDGRGRAVTLTPNGDRLYVAVADDEDEGATDDGHAPPDRGLVAVLDIREEDCTLAFDALIDGHGGCGDHGGGCAGCGGRGACAGHGGDGGPPDGPRSVVLGHIAGYVYRPNDDGPRIRDPGLAESGDLVLDNLTYRPIVPSAAVLKDVIECIVAQGVAEGPPGPRGESGHDGAPGADGQDGQDGRSVTEITVALGAPSSAPSAETSPNATGLTLALTIPAAAPGADGLGIDDATVTYVPGLADPTVAVVERSGQRILDIGLPEPRPSRPNKGISIVGTSWLHDERHPKAPNLPAFADLLAGQGLAVAFAEPVLWRSFRREGGVGPTMVAELQLPLLTNGLVHWVNLSKLSVHPITAIEMTDGLITSWKVLDEPDDAGETLGFALIGEMHVDARFDPDLAFRVVLYADFVVNADGRAVDGNHIGGLLPTGPNGPGDTFRGWFRVSPG